MNIRHRMPVKMLPLLIAVCLFGFASAVADEVSRAAMLSNTCAGCHGTGGISPGTIPTIDCRSADTIVKTLMDFRDGKVFSTVMGRHIKGYTDEEIKQVAGYFAANCGTKGK